MNIIAIAQGIILGIAAVLPGFSTSVAAVLMGIYEKLIDALDSLRKDFKNAFKYLLPLGIGAVLGILLSVKLILKVCEIYPVQSFFFFTGLVIGGLPLIFRKIKQVKFKPVYLLISLACFAVLYVVSMVNESGAENFIDVHTLSSAGDFVKMMIAGAFSVSLMAIPGVSGSIMLIIVGQYGTIYNSASMAIDMIVFLVKGDMVGFREALGSVLLLVPFCIGALLGVLLIARILNYLLKKFEALVYYGVLGIMLSSVVTLVIQALRSWPTNQTGTDNLVLIVLSLLLVAIGVFCAIFLDSPPKEGKKDENNDKTESETVTQN